MNQLNMRVAVAIGLLDRMLSELKELALDPALDAADRQTVKHHAEDCVGLGNRVLEILDGQTKIVGWWDHFNQVLYTDDTSANNAQRGGNRITPVTVRLAIKPT